MAEQPDRAAVANAADEQQVKRASKRDVNARDREISDIKLALAHPTTRRLVWRILCFSGIKDTCFSTDPLTMAARCGQRDLALWLEREIMLADTALMARIRSEAELLARIDDAALDTKTDGLDPDA
jgi:hypothetical protein